MQHWKLVVLKVFFFSLCYFFQREKTQSLAELNFLLFISHDLFIENLSNY